MIALLLLLQAAPPTVGDTIWLERAVTAPAGAEVRAAPWSPAGPIGLLGRALLRQEGAVTIIAYPAVAWSAGRHVVSVPGPIVIHPDGTTDSLPSQSTTIEVASVLPAGVAPDSLDVQPETGILAQRVTTPLPLVAALLLAAGVFVPLRWWWQRRGPPGGTPRLSAIPVSPPLAEWSEDGEHRAVAAVAALELRRVMVGRLPGVQAGIITSRLIGIVAEQKPGWPAEEIATLLRALDSAQFAEAPGAEVVELAERAARLAARLESAA